MNTQTQTEPTADKAQHTAGPWTQEGCAIYTQRRLENSTPGHSEAQRLVACCPDMDCGSEYGARENLPEYEEAYANARLIASAPELLAALREIRALAAGIKRSHAANVIAVKAADAITKATGRAE